MTFFLLPSFIGAAAGVGLSFVAQAAGSHCTIMCRPGAAALVGAMFGIAWAAANHAKGD
ncbi:hypothetical protein K8I61_01550 [bacterium]|nr:hypothetical protein [bacterium]